MQTIKIPLNDGYSLEAVHEDLKTIRVQLTGNNGVQKLVEVRPSANGELFYVDIILHDNVRECYSILKEKAP